jgi:hypothetical protein
MPSSAAARPSPSATQRAPLPSLFPYPLRRMRRVLRQALWKTGLIEGVTPASGRIEKYVFVVTYGRSGSTLVQKLIGGLPGYHMRGENCDALRGIAATYRAASMTRETFGPTPVAPDDPWYGAYEIEPRRYAEALVNLFVREILAPPPDARAIGFKEIRYFFDLEGFEDYIAFIREFLAPARFVFNVRAPEAVAGSSWWKEVPREEVIDRISGWNTFIEDYVRRHPDDCLLLRYDEFVAKPESVRTLFDFLGEPYDPTHVACVFEKKLKH